MAPALNFTLKSAALIKIDPTEWLHRAGPPATRARVVAAAGVAVGETVMLLRLPLPVAGVSIEMERGRQQNDSLADGHP